MARRASRHVQLPTSEVSEASYWRRVELSTQTQHAGSSARRPWPRSGPTLLSPGPIMHARHRVDNVKPHLPRMALALAYTAFPCAVFPLTAQKPLTPTCLRACMTASIHFFNALCAQFFLARADAALLTTFPVLLLVRESFVKPPTVFAFLPLKTADLANLPLAITLTFFTFFIAFMPFIAAFMAGAMASTKVRS